MVRLIFTRLMACLAVSALVTLTAPTAHAIPTVDGTYDVTGDGISGQFTLIGTDFTSYSFEVTTYLGTFVTSGTTSYVYESIPIDLTAFYTPLPDGDWRLRIFWDDSALYPLIYEPILVTSTISGSLGVHTFSYQLREASAVPEPSSALLAGLGLLLLLGYGFRQQRQAELQIG